MRLQNTVNFLQRGKNLPLFQKIMYIIRRGKENDSLLHHSNFSHDCSLDLSQAGRLFSKTEIQKAGKRIERNGNGQRNNNHSKVFFHKIEKQIYSRGMYGPRL
jgi:hypothetical protein